MASSFPLLASPASKSRTSSPRSASWPQQIETQLNIYPKLAANTATLPSHMWGQVESDLNQLRSIVDQGPEHFVFHGNAMTCCSSASKLFEP